MRTQNPYLQGNFAPVDDEVTARGIQRDVAHGHGRDIRFAIDAAIPATASQRGRGIGLAAHLERARSLTTRMSRKAVPLTLPVRIPQRDEARDG